jgi:hypothetical protein
VPPTPTPTPKPKLWPLTGLPVAADAQIGRRPLNVRLPNDPNARPQYGLNKADLVFEMIVEGGITRFSAIFHSKDADTVGPVRSYRFSDLHITQMLRGALVSSGSTVEERDAVTQSIKDGNMLSVDAERDGRPYYRVAFRPAPNNEFTGTLADREAVNRAGGSAAVDVPPLAFVAVGNTESNESRRSALSSEYSLMIAVAASFQGVGPVGVSTTSSTASRPPGASADANRGMTRSRSIQCRLVPAVTSPYGGSSGAVSAVALIQRSRGSVPLGSRRPSAIIAADGSTASIRVVYGSSCRATAPVPVPTSSTTRGSTISSARISNVAGG